ncbi:MAG: bifunctional diaminohydroxyphosphoribosylaminopyrimidine deaminase/5-amino-6-(5-phosphoribosylamino)uracil reductase RibD [Candidatus Symbiothrix sp.]|jgi:diaminohydroxyphosphoribosylaminopyrimidine deaminase/5-amino-6-(5-phosphoribosylamino)uracil reductase|nr:bifunctional diaminohydroxyphosphoribosylaminopyrimidine deaminase/5-amino-6-(5-phosphoribosylamino)uracil reductase RibD [Candidatus Symbiothrix sp.]
MRRCLELAKKGIGSVAPNPMVGAVIVHKGKIIGEGYHRKWGEAHAEVNAIHSVRKPELLKDSTLYVNLEPCAHYGKTPPCVELIIEKQIPRVVIGQTDPFPQVAGKGIERLRNAGIEVVMDVLKEECEELNKRFLTFVNKKRPYIILKWAQSSDGYIDKIREINDGQKPVVFSNDFTRTLVHKMRAEETAIMVGSRTQELDKPLLNVRYWHGNDPVKIKADSRKTLPELMRELHAQGIQSLIVEGGASLLQSFLKENLWDEAQIEVSAMELKEGVKAPVISGRLKSVQKCEKTLILLFKN